MKRFVFLIILIAVVAIPFAGQVSPVAAAAIGRATPAPAAPVSPVTGGVVAGLIAAIPMIKLIGAIVQTTPWGKKRGPDIDKILGVLDNEETLEVIDHLGTKEGRTDLAKDVVGRAIDRNKKHLPAWIKLDSAGAADAAVTKAGKLWHKEITERKKAA